MGRNLGSPRAFPRQTRGFPSHPHGWFGLIGEEDTTIMCKLRSGISVFEIINCNYLKILSYYKIMSSRLWLIKGRKWENQGDMW
jgi:hypothetical protein